MAEAFRCDVLTAVPTVVCPCWSAGATAIIAAFSIRATSAGVANTGISPEPIFSAVSDSATVILLINFNPGVSIIKY
jgi:hypothetical protein